MSTFGVGKEVLSYCTKCKLTLAHTIVTMKSETALGKVMCNTCKATHAYKDPSKVKATKTRARKTSKTTKKEDSVADIWMDAISKTKAKSQDYSPKKKFELKDIIDHPKFGPGVIDRVIDNNKIQVIFRHDIKVLVHNMS